jgi:Cof subfamily protein (haloacid dehalogenase superfamily)
MGIRLIALDIDGTLLDSAWRVPAANREAIAAATALGVEVALVTGRRYDFALPVVAELEGPLTLIVNNGALVKSWQGATLFKRPLPCDVARLVLEATVPFRAGTGVIFDRPRVGQVIFERIDWDNPLRRAYAELSRDFVEEVSPLETCLTEDPLQLMFNGRVGEMRDLVVLLQSMRDAGRFSLAVTEYVARDFSLVDVMAAGCSKGSTLADWCNRRRISAREVMAVGDNLNDIEMLGFAGHPIVMANAVPALKAVGWPLTLSNDECGVAAAIERLVLGDTGPEHAGPEREELKEGY